MNIFPAIDIYGGKVVRLFKGDYNQMTVFSEDPVSVAKDFVKAGAKFIHIVDLEGAKDGELHNFDIIAKIKKETGLFCEVGGGIRNAERIEKYINAGIDRVILGTVAAENPEFLAEMVAKYGKNIAVGADFKDGFVATHGWTEKTDLPAVAFCKKMEDLGVSTFICTDISKDGANRGTNIKLYKTLKCELNADIIASGGVSNIDNVRTLSKIGVYGAIIGRAYYDGLIDLKEAIEVAK